MRNTNVLLASHVFYTEIGPVYGPVDVLKDYFLYKKINCTEIKYPLTSRYPLVLKSAFETLNTIYKSILVKPNLFIGIDPLNAIAGVFLKKIGLVKKTIFYCVDYTPTRFTNFIINNIYLYIDKYCALNSDEVWNVSSRIVDVRKDQGVAQEKIKLVPNTPRFSDCKRVSVDKINRNQIVMVGGLTHSNVLDLVLKSFIEVSKKIPKLKLKIIGSIKDKSQKNVEFLGQLKNDELLKIVSESGIALSIYSFSKKYSWVYYGDSKKTREYLASGVPVIITDVVGTSMDVKKYNAGIVVKPKIKELANAIEKLNKDYDFWLNCRKNAIKNGRDSDITKILDSVLF